MYDTPEGYNANTGYQVAFGLFWEPLGLPKGFVVFSCVPYQVGGHTKNLCGIRVYDYDDTLFPAHKRVIQCNVRDYAYWHALSKEAYQEEKQRLADTLKYRVKTHILS